MPALHVREVVEGPQVQGASEEIAWSIDITNWGSSPTSITVKAYNSDGTDVTSTVMPTGSASTPDATTIKLPVLKALTSGEQYKIVVTFTVNTQKVGLYFIVIAEV
jgi:hypothetical protein